jgi:hypothetical protein
LRLAARVFEIGPGTGLATKRLLDLGADPLVVGEPDERLANYLKVALGKISKRIEIRVASFEDVLLPKRFSIWEWPQQLSIGLIKRLRSKRLLRFCAPGGWWAMWWTVCGNPSKPDNFYEAVGHLFQGLDRSPSSGSTQGPPFALEVDARIADLRSTGKFEKIENQMFRTSEIFQTAELLELYGTFSEISRLGPIERNRLLEKLSAVSQNQPLKVEIKGVKTSHFLELKTAPRNSPDAGPMEHVELPKSEPANNDLQFTRPRLVPTTDRTRAWDRSRDRQPVFAVSKTSHFNHRA